MKKMIFFLSLVYYQSVLSEEIASKTKEIMTADSFTSNEECKSTKQIDGKDYCLRRSSITLNSCGRTSDWPCMDEQGCLIIDKFTLKN